MNPFVALALSPIWKILVLFTADMAVLVILDDIIAAIAEIVISNQHVLLIPKFVIAHDAF